MLLLLCCFFCLLLFHSYAVLVCLCRAKAFVQRMLSFLRPLNSGCCVQKATCSPMSSEGIRAKNATFLRPLNSGNCYAMILRTSTASVKTMGFLKQIHRQAR